LLPTFSRCQLICRHWWHGLYNTGPWLIYALLLLFWYLLNLFQHHAVEMGWGLLALVVSLPFVPFVMVYLLLALRQHLQLLRRGQGNSKPRHLLHSLIVTILIMLFLVQFI